MEDFRQTDISIPSDAGSLARTLDENGITSASAVIPEAPPSTAQLARQWVKSHGSPLFVLDCERLRQQYQRLSAALPGVDLHYAMKALPLPSVISALAEEGCSFDVASTGEIDVLKTLGISPERSIHTHPIKRDQDIRAALAYGCRTFVVDNVAEIAKFVPYRDAASLVLRIGFRSSDAVVDLAKKFGCAPEEAYSLLNWAHQLGVRVEGLSFHVGSQCSSSRAHVAAIQGCLQLMDAARSRGLSPITTLDIGGGFPVSYQTEATDIDVFCAPIRHALRQVPSQVRVVAEPGRYLAGPAVQTVASVLGKANRGGVLWYYLDDGVFGSYSGQIYDGARYPLMIASSSHGERRLSVLAGPTCDSVDIVAEHVMIPELEIGDLIIARSMGAYTVASASDFNMVARAKLLVLGRSGGADGARGGGAQTGPALIPHETL